MFIFIVVHFIKYFLFDLRFIFFSFLVVKELPRIITLWYVIVFDVVTNPGRK